MRFASLAHPSNALIAAPSAAPGGTHAHAHAHDAHAPSALTFTHSLPIQCRYTRWNTEVIEAVRSGFKEEVARLGVAASDIYEIQVRFYNDA